MKVILKSRHDGRIIECKILTYKIIFGGEMYTYDNKIFLKIQDPLHLIEDIIKSYRSSNRFDFIIDDGEKRLEYESLKIIQLECISVDLNLHEMILANGAGIY